MEASAASAAAIPKVEIDIYEDYGDGIRVYKGYILVDADLKGQIYLDPLLTNIHENFVVGLVPNQNNGTPIMKYLIVSCRTTDKPRRGKKWPLIIDRTRRIENEMFMSIECHGHQKNEKLKFDKGEVYFRGDIRDQCRVYPYSEQYDAFMSCVTSLDHKHYPIPSTNNLVETKGMNVTLRHMTTKRDFSNLERHDTFKMSGCYEKYMKSLRTNSGLTRLLALPGYNNSSLGKRKRDSSNRASNHVSNHLSNAKTSRSKRGNNRMIGLLAPHLSNFKRLLGKKKGDSSNRASNANTSNSPRRTRRKNLLKNNVKRFQRSLGTDTRKKR